jgi:phosphoribosylglycinamide formyltransferase-1
MSEDGRTLGILISGRGTNLQAILDAVRDGKLHARIGVVISNVATAAGLERARKAGAPTAAIDHKSFATREDFDRRVVEELEKHQVDVVCLAGFMRLLSPVLIRAFPGRILNIHPSLLPSFPGLHGQRQALDYGVKVSGCTVHIVDEELDHGPILLQASVLVEEDDTEESLSARILREEHRIYPEAVGLLLDGKFQIEGRRAIIVG